jgi:DNA topoisomerase-3
VAAEIAKAIDPNAEKQDGFIQTSTDLVSWAQGHLVDPKEPDEYETAHPEWKKWSLDYLPMIPDPWEWKVNHERGVENRYRSLAALMRRSDVTELVNCCDPDREGEAIFRRIVSYAKCTKPSRRLWVASLDGDAIRHAMTVMKPSSVYDGLADAADARAKADWLVGMNASRAYGLVYNRRLSVGRVQTPTLKLVVDRDLQISRHQVTSFWKIALAMSEAEPWTLTSEKIESQQTAEDYARTCRNGSLQITGVERKAVSTPAPNLYDLTSLQKDCNRIYGLTAARTLSALQSLYEKKLTSYPRTDSKYITSDDLESFKKLLTGQNLKDGFLPNPDDVTCDDASKVVANDKVAGHTAILPTRNLSVGSFESLSDDEKKVVTRIVRRVWEAVSPTWKHQTVTVQAEAESVPVKFSAHSDTTISLGWKTVDQNSHDDSDKDQEDENRVPAGLKEGDDLSPRGTAVKEGKTQPPKHLTEASLLAAMEHASRFVDNEEFKKALNDDTSHSGGIGTPATRADILEKLVNKKYLERKGKQLISTDEGRLLISVVAPSLASVESTADMESKLNDVEHGEMTEADYLADIQCAVKLIPQEARENFQQDKKLDRDAKRETFGICPRCGASVIKTGKLWQCETNKSARQANGTWKEVSGCGFKIWPKLASKALSDSVVRKVLDGSAPLVKGFVSKSGKKFDARLKMSEMRGVEFSFEGN